MGGNGRGWDGMGWNGMEWDGMGWNGKEWEGMAKDYSRTEELRLALLELAAPSPNLSPGERDYFALVTSPSPFGRGWARVPFIMMR